MVNKRFPVGSC